MTASESPEVHCPRSEIECTYPSKYKLYQQRVMAKTLVVNGKLA